MRILQKFQMVLKIFYRFQKFLNIFIEILKFSLQLCCNKTLNDEEKIKQVFVELPKNTQKYLLFQMVNNPNVTDNVVSEMKRELDKKKKEGVNIDYWKQEKNINDKKYKQDDFGSLFR